jgi:ABC-type multidrug transport system fused ATPase/permease subunit
MDGLEAESYDRSYRDRELVNRIVRYFRPHAGKMLLIASMVVLQSVMDAALPILSAWGINQLADSDGQIDPIVWWIIAGIFVTGIFSWSFNYVRQSRTAMVVGDVVLKLRLNVFRAVMRRDLSFFDEHPSGKIVSRVTSDTEDFANTVTLALNLVSQILLLVIVTIVLFSRSVQLALLTLLISPIVVALALAFRKIARDSTRGAQRATADVNNVVRETMSGIAVTKNFRQEETIYGEFQEINARSYRVTVRQGFIFASIFPLLFTVAGLGTTLLVYVGGRDVVNGDVSAGDWYLFLQAIALFWFPLTGIASFWSQFQQGLSSAERVFALIDATPRVIQTDDQPAGKIRGHIEFRDVDFGYVDDQPVLQKFNLTIEAGELVALVGHTGAGKSTLGKLVARFYEFQAGQILIDGRDIRILDLESYRHQLGFVPQMPFLFSGTVAENIRYPRPNASDEEVEIAARRLGYGDWIEALPQGLQTEIGEQGRGLSMGQRQLVALARVLIQDAAIVILDEATASVDPLTEAQIQEGLDQVLKGRTSIVIAHRLVTVRHADRIIVLRNGQIVEEGNHDALMLKHGPYAQLYNTYFRHQSPDYRPGEGFVEVAAGVTI